MNTVSPLSPIPPVGSATSDSGSKGKNSQLRQGQTFKATVLEAKSPTTFILEIGGNKIAAQAKTPLSIGQTLQLQVTSTSPQVEMRILSDSTNLLAGKSITLLGENIDIQSLFTALRNATPSPLTDLNTYSKQTLESFFFFNQEALAGKEGGGILKQLIDRLGISFEALLARGDKNSAKMTLKSALLELAHVFKGADQLAESTNRLLSTIELYQLAQLQLEKDNVFIFPLPVPFLEKGYLIVENEGSGHNNEENNEKRFSLHLSLQGLGNLRIDLLKNIEGLYIRFISDSQNTLDFIEQFKDDLLLNTVDANILGVSFSHEHIDPAADLLKRLLPQGESIVNTKV